MICAIILKALLTARDSPLRFFAFALPFLLVLMIFQLGIFHIGFIHSVLTDIMSLPIEANGKVDILIFGLVFIPAVPFFLVIGPIFLEGCLVFCRIGWIVGLRDRKIVGLLIKWSLACLDRNKSQSPEWKDNALAKPWRYMMYSVLLRAFLTVRDKPFLSFVAFYPIVLVLFLYHSLIMILPLEFLPFAQENFSVLFVIYVLLSILLIPFYVTFFLLCVEIIWIDIYLKFLLRFLSIKGRRRFVNRLIRWTSDCLANYEEVTTKGGDHAISQ